MKGRKPNLKVINGGADLGRCPGAPAWLTVQAKREWKRSAPELHNRGLLKPDVMQTFEAYCVAAGQVREFEEIMAAEGRLITTDDGQKPHRAFGMQLSAMREARLLAGELGLTPHRRCAADKGQEEKGNGWDQDLLA